MSDEQKAALAELDMAWIQFINCWSDPFDDPEAEDREERDNVKALGKAFDQCRKLGLFPDYMALASKR